MTKHRYLVSCEITHTWSTDPNEPRVINSRQRERSQFIRDFYYITTNTLILTILKKEIIDFWERVHPDDMFLVNFISIRELTDYERYRENEDDLQDLDHFLTLIFTE